MTTARRRTTTAPHDVPGRPVTRVAGLAPVHGWEPPASRLTAGPVVLGAALTGVIGYGIALWLAHEAVYAERVEEDAYCGPAAHPAGEDGVRLS
ncbi:MAG: hypothetical protein JWN17_2364 [Frankiales bacterium]|nr:hypothetical protein [Frankiales bacterium]